MRVVFLVVTTCCLLVNHLKAQDEVIDVNEVLGRKEKYLYTKLYAVRDGSVLIDLKSELVLINTNGRIVHRCLNPLASKKYIYNMDQHVDYDKETDVYYRLVDGSFVFVKNFSTEKPELIEVKVPKLEKLIGSAYAYNDKNFNKPAISTVVEFIDENNLIVARSYVSMSKNSHGTEIPKKNKYNSFVQLTYINLKSLEVKEEYVFKDVFEIERKKGTDAIISVLGFKNNEFRIGILELNKKKFHHPVILGYSYSGKYRIQSYNIETKEIENIGTITITPEQNTVCSSIELVENGVAVSWTQRKDDFYSLHNKTYKIIESGEIDSVRYEFPTDLVSLIEPQIKGVFNYTNLNGEEFAVLAGNFVKNKRDKDPARAYVLVDGEQNSEVRNRNERNTSYYDSERKNIYAVDLEIQDEELLGRIDKPLPEKEYNPYLSAEDCMIVKVDDKKIIVIKYWIESKGTADYIISSGAFLIQFVEFEL